MASPVRSVYLASPLGFSAAGRYYYADVLLPAVAAAGLSTLDPWYDPDQQIVTALAIVDAGQRETALHAANGALGARNASMIRSSAGVLAVLDGADVDSGTAAEVGFAAALGLPIVGLRTDLRQTGEQGSAVNLQVQWFIEQSGGSVLADLVAAVQALAALVSR
jgi:nucleoside 2-deoxyribosyltransferase